MVQGCRHEFGNTLPFPAPIMQPQGAEVQIARLHQAFQDVTIEVQADGAIPAQNTQERSGLFKAGVDIKLHDPILLKTRTRKG